ncbi:MAG: glutamyl-tRNA reductase [Verrucomicrobiota bacterium]|nr:glutamyl-tRNA reductase [Verrucomicrobiota bacterium]
MSAAQGGFFHLGASHHTAAMSLREKLALTPEKNAALAGRLAALGELREWTVLNTCNRLEFYGVAGSAAAIDRLQAEFCGLVECPPADFASAAQRAFGRDALRHLLAVAAGLDSQMLGETEIFGQVKEAYATAQRRGTTGPVLNRVFQKIFQAAKFIRTHTAISEGQVSVANVAVDLALKIFGEIDVARVLLLGAGEIGEKTARAFLSRGVTALTVSSRRLERAMELAQALTAAALPFEHAPGKLAEFDIVVSATAAPGTVIGAEVTAAAMRRRPARPLFFIDLALPRDVEPGVAELPNVFLYNLDDLAKIAEKNRMAREAELERAQILVSEKTEALWQRVEPLIGGELPTTQLPAARSAT